jgi:outer membrane protein OmpA-like peptidoglycan-associated protein
MNRKTLTMAIAITLPAFFIIACGTHETRQVSEEGIEQQMNSQPEEVVVGDEVAMPSRVLIEEDIVESNKVESELINQVTVALEEKETSQPSDLVFYFDTNQSTVKQADFDALITHAEYLIKHPEIKLKLIGHTDQSGDSQYNQWLAKKRSDSVAQIFIQYGVQAEQLSMESKGEDFPVSGFEHAIYDRRVELEYSEKTQLSER